MEKADGRRARRERMVDVVFIVGSFGFEFGLT